MMMIQHDTQHESKNKQTRRNLEKEPGNPMRLLLLLLIYVNTIPSDRNPPPFSFKNSNPPIPPPPHYPVYLNAKTPRSILFTSKTPLLKYGYTLQLPENSTTPPCASSSGCTSKNPTCLKPVPVGSASTLRTSTIRSPLL